ncbi:MAG: hypothetical protein R6X02_10265 [Enhygromyxa sp.]
MTRRYFLIPTSLAMGLAFGCFDPGVKDCPTGTEGCACTIGGSCDGELVCASEICVALGGADTTGDGNPGDGDGDPSEGDGDQGDGDGDGDQGDGDGDGDQGDGDGDTCGKVGDSCDPHGCCDGLSCDGFGVCGLGGGDGDCLPDDPWCPTHPDCMNALTTQDYEDYAWCWHTCDPAAMNSTSACPAAPEGTELQCISLGRVDRTLGGCIMLCTVDSDVCPEGATCLDIGGTGACMYSLE